MRPTKGKAQVPRKRLTSRSINFHKRKKAFALKNDEYGFCSSDDSDNPDRPPSPCPSSESEGLEKSPPLPPAVVDENDSRPSSPLSLSPLPLAVTMLEKKDEDDSRPPSPLSPLPLAVTTLEKKDQDDSRPPSPLSPLPSAVVDEYDSRPSSPASPLAVVVAKEDKDEPMSHIPGLGPSTTLDSTEILLGLSDNPSISLRPTDYQWQEEIDRLQPPVSRAHQEKRLGAVAKLNHALTIWSEAYRKTNGLDYMTNGNLYCLKVAGSFRFGVYTESSDIDVLLIGSIYIEPSVFFGSLSKSLAAHEGMDKVLNIPKTRVPIIALEVDGIPIDLLLASTSMALLPEPFNPLDASLMESTDSKTLQSLNSARVTDYVLRYATSSVFVPLLKLVRLWAKARGVFGAKYGYLGGVQWCLCILSLFQRKGLVCSLDEMVLAFFSFMVETVWERQVLALKPLGHDVSTRNWYSDRRKYDEAMVVLTPTQPYTNTTYNVNPNSMIHLDREFSRALTLVKGGKVKELFQSWLAVPKTLVKEGFKAFLHANFSPLLGQENGKLAPAAEKEYEAEKGRIDSKMRMLALSIFKTHHKVVKETRLIVRCEEEKDKMVCHWIYGICLLKKGAKNQCLDLNSLLQSFRSEMKLGTMRHCQLTFQPMGAKDFRLWLNTR